ncbi:hypothetical protein, partial [Burkholderia ubonensis]|uniref:hypothetical protein n=1 Tax=Burkholderia ubonensis TaxID=101571 RepID=UPI001E3DA2C8
PDRRQTRLRFDQPAYGITHSNFNRAIFLHVTEHFHEHCKFFSKLASIRRAIGVIVHRAAENDAELRNIPLFCARGRQRSARRSLRGLIPKRVR